MTNAEKVNLDWQNLRFDYVKTDLRYFSRWTHGSWGPHKLSEKSTFEIHEGSTVLHYGQSCFEGLKAQTAKDGRVLLFRPYENAKRMQMSAERLMMPNIPEEMFVEACKLVAKNNMRWVPPYGYGASFYLRPYLFGVGANVGVKPAPEFIFSVFGIPAGVYFKGGLQPVKFITTDFDRAAPNGTGGAKAGGNYAGSLLPHEKAVRDGYADCIYLDPTTHTKIEEVGAANFFGITDDNRFITPKSPSILPSITKYSLMHIAEKYLGMRVEERDVEVDKLDQFVEAGACGTAAVITPIGVINHKGKEHAFYGDGKEVGPVTKKLYDLLTGIQRGEVEAPEGWITEVE